MLSICITIDSIFIAILKNTTTKELYSEYDLDFDD